MHKKKVRDIMIPVGDYASVGIDAGYIEILTTLNESQANLPENMQPFRAVLIVDNDNKIIGKIGHLQLLKALQPQFKPGYKEDKALTAVNNNIMDSMMENLRILEDNVLDLCEKIKNKKAKDIMLAVTDFIDENASIEEAIHKITTNMSLSILVKKDKSVTGILRLSDLYTEIEAYILQNCK